MRFACRLQTIARRRAAGSFAWFGRPLFLPRRDTLAVRFFWSVERHPAHAHPLAIWMCERSDPRRVPDIRSWLEEKLGTLADFELERSAASIAHVANTPELLPTSD